MMKHILLGTLGFLCMASASWVQAGTLYAIGNSLTNDMYPNGVEALARDAGEDLSVHYHIRSASSLTYMKTYPTDVTLTRPAVWNEALAAQSYEFVTLQPYRYPGNPTIGSEAEAAATIVEFTLSREPRTVFYLYEAWPSQEETGGEYHAYWTQAIAGLDSTPFQTRASYDLLLGELRSHFADRAAFRVIPIGDVFDRIAVDARAGTIPGIVDIADLYRDPIHMGEIGRFVAATTVLTTIYQRQINVNNSIDAYQFNDSQAELTPTLAQQLSDIIWQVVSNDSRTGVLNEQDIVPDIDEPADDVDEGTDTEDSAGEDDVVDSGDLPSSDDGATAGEGSGASTAEEDGSNSAKNSSGTGYLDAWTLCGLILLIVWGRMYRKGSGVVFG